jgi:hypothetical protein
MGARTVHQLKVTIEGTKPPVWRRLLVPSDVTLADLHHVFQTAFGWEDYHLHEFEVAGHRFGVVDGEDWQPPRDERRYRLNTVAHPGSSFVYVYDFGDDWCHRVLVEKVLPRDKDTRYPTCIGGRRAGPPEDCGGVWGYADLVDAMEDPAHPERDRLLEWLGEPFDPAAFDAAEVDRRLRPRLVAL